MRLKKASLTFAGAAAAVAVTTLAASPAWACNDRDPQLKLQSICGKLGPAWTLSNPNTFGVPATWIDDKGGKSLEKINVPARSSIPLPTHATKVIVTAYRIDKGGQPVWERHGAAGALLSCKGDLPSTKPTEKPKPTVEPTQTSEAPKPVTPPSGEAGPATPVHAQPEFTG
jgi:hypothetical protein